MYIEIGHSFIDKWENQNKIYEVDYSKHPFKNFFTILWKYWKWWWLIIEETNIMTYDFYGISLTDVFSFIDPTCSLLGVVIYLLLQDDLQAINI